VLLRVQFRDRDLTMSSLAGVLSEAGTINPVEGPGFTPCFIGWVRVAIVVVFSVFCIMLCVCLVPMSLLVHSWFSLTLICYVEFLLTLEQCNMLWLAMICMSYATIPKSKRKYHTVGTVPKSKRKIAHCRNSSEI
jgi:hypothetical protein